MKTAFSKFLICCLLLAAGPVAAEWGGRMSEGDAIDRAGMQRMLTQRMLKAYCELGLRELYSNPQQQIARSSNQFEANLLELDSYVKDPEARKGLDRVKELWPAYKELAAKEPSKENAAQLLELNGRLLPLTHEVVVKLEKALGTSAGQWVNLAGRQRMLSQRMAMYYLMEMWGVPDPKRKEQLAKAQNDYLEALRTLAQFEGNTEETRKLLASLESSYNFLAKAMGQQGNNLSFLVATTSEKMLEEADKLTSLYAAMKQK